MNDPILQYINSGKKLSIKLEKLLSSLYHSDFSGTVTVIGAEEPVQIFILEKKAYFDRSPLVLSALNDKTLFKIDSAIPEGVKAKNKEYDLLEFIFKIIENIDRYKILSLLKPFATEFFSIKPEAGKMMFLYTELEPFIGIQRIEISANLKKNYRTIYFLLTTRFAGVVRASDAEKAEIQEKVNRTSMFDESQKEGFDSKDSFENGDLSDEQKIIIFLNNNDRFRDAFSLFGLKYGFDDKDLHREYLKIVQKIHPDRLHDISPATREKAEKFLKTVSENYELLKDPVNRDDMNRLMKKYGPIRTRTDYVKLKEYDEAMFKGTTMLRLGQFEGATIVFNEIFNQTGNPDALEKKIFSIWNLAPKWNDARKTEKYKEIKDDILKLILFKNPDFEIFFILAEIYEFYKMIPDCMKTLVLILKHDPENMRAKGMKKRLMYYEQQDKNKNK